MALHRLLSCHEASNECEMAMLVVIRAKSWEGPYEVMSRTACSIGEDHSMYIDKRGFHCISHRFSIPRDPICKEAGGCTIFDATRDGGHAFSAHGWNDTWYCADGKGGHAHCTPDQPPAYNATIVSLVCPVCIVLRPPVPLRCKMFQALCIFVRLPLPRACRYTNKAECTSSGPANVHTFYSMATLQWQSPTLCNTARPRTCRMSACLETHTLAMRATTVATTSGQVIKIGVGQRSPRCAQPSQPLSLLNLACG